MTGPDPREDTFRWLVDPSGGARYLAGVVVATAAVHLAVSFLTRDGGLIAMAAGLAVPMGVLALTVFVALVKLGPPRSPAFWARALAGAYLAGVLVAFGYHEMVDTYGRGGDPQIHLGVALVWPMGLIIDLVWALL